MKKKEKKLMQNKKKMGICLGVCLEKKKMADDFKLSHRFYFRVFKRSRRLYRRRR